MKRSIADVNIRKISTLLNKLPTYDKLPMTNIRERDIVDITGNKIKVKLDSSIITIDIRKPKDLDPNVLSAVVGALKKERAEATETYIIERVAKGAKFRKSQIQKFESRGIKHFKERVAKISGIRNIEKLQNATSGYGTSHIEDLIRDYVNENLQDVRSSDSLFEYMYFDLFGASGYNKGELLGFMDWLDAEGYVNLDELLFDLFDYSEDELDEE